MLQLFDLRIDHNPAPNLALTHGLRFSWKAKSERENVFQKTYRVTVCKENEIVDRAGEIIDVNYMYSMAPDNPLLDLFYEWLPLPFWYMLPVIPIVLIYLGAIYGIAALVKKRKTA